MTDSINPIEKIKAAEKEAAEKIKAAQEQVRKSLAEAIKRKEREAKQISEEVAKKAEKYFCDLERETSARTEEDREKINVEVNNFKRNAAGNVAQAVDFVVDRLVG